MAHPVIEEMNRCYSLEHVQSHAFRRWQRVLREEIQAELDKVPVLAANHALLTAHLAVLTEENTALKAEVDRLTAKKAQKATAAV